MPSKIRTPLKFTRFFSCAAVLVVCCAKVQGQQNPPEKKPQPETSSPFQFNGQATFILQNLFKFRSLYEGVNSLRSRNEMELSQTYTLYIGARVRPNMELYVNPEMARGHGVSEALGLAGYANGEVIRNPSLSQDPYLGRYFARWNVATGKGTEKVEDAQNQVAGTRPIRRVVITAGKIGVSDIFDLNTYANSARTQFMNWALLNNGAYDYAADTRGYTLGVAAEWVNPGFTVRLGSFQMPTVANGVTLAGNILNNRGDQLEVETHPNVLRYKGPLILRLLGYRNMAHMGDYRQSIALAKANGTIPDITQTETTGNVKYGFGVNLEQPLGDGGNTGLFARYSWDDGATESYAYTEIDRHISIGAQISGARWRRPTDRFALALVQNDLSAAHKDYLAAGGIGFIIGDGKLNYGSEQILESYYTAQFSKSIGVSLDYQFINNPAYNRDRGPVSILSLRSHFEF